MYVADGAESKTGNSCDADSGLMKDRTGCNDLDVAAEYHFDSAQLPLR